LRQESVKYATIDVETTGFSPDRGDRIIEVGAVILEGGLAVDEFHSLVDPGRRISFQAQQVNGITEEMLEGQPTPTQVFPLLHEFIRGAVLVAHNAGFDLSFLRHEFARLGLACNHRHICTLELSRLRYPQLRNHKLETVFRHVAGSCAERQQHRALADARMVAAIWLAMEKY